MRSTHVIPSKARNLPLRVSVRGLGGYSQSKNWHLPSPAHIATLVRAPLRKRRGRTLPLAFNTCHSEPHLSFRAERGISPLRVSVRGLGGCSQSKNCHFHPRHPLCRTGMKLRRAQIRINLLCLPNLSTTTRAHRVSRIDGAYSMPTAKSSEGSPVKSPWS